MAQDLPSNVVELAIVQPFPVLRYDDVALPLCEALRALAIEPSNVTERDMREWSTDGSDWVEVRGYTLEGYDREQHPRAVMHALERAGWLSYHDGRYYFTELGISTVLEYARSGRIVPWYTQERRYSEE